MGLVGLLGRRLERIPIRPDPCLRRGFWFSTFIHPLGVLQQGSAPGWPFDFVDNPTITGQLRDDAKILPDLLFHIPECFSFVHK